MFGNSNIYDTAMYLIMTGQTDNNKGVVAKIYNSGRKFFVCQIDIWYEIKSYISIYIPYYNFNENEHTDKY